MDKIQPSRSLNEAKNDLIQRFNFFEQWKDRYQYLIELAKKLPPFDEQWQQDSNRIQGCQSQVWLVCEIDEDRLFFSAASDAKIVGGMISLLLLVFNGRTAEEILQDDLSFIAQLGLLDQLSPNRANGLHQMVKRMRELASAHSQA